MIEMFLHIFAILLRDLEELFSVVEAFALR